MASPARSGQRGRPIGRNGGTEGEIRTPTGSRPADFKSAASAGSATSARRSRESYPPAGRQGVPGEDHKTSLRGPSRWRRAGGGSALAPPGIDRAPASHHQPRVLAVRCLDQPEVVPGAGRDDLHTWAPGSEMDAATCHAPSRPCRRSPCPVAASTSSGPTAGVRRARFRPFEQRQATSSGSCSRPSGGRCPIANRRRPSTGSFLSGKVEATVGFGPTHRGFAGSAGASPGVRGRCGQARTGSLFERRSRGRTPLLLPVLAPSGRPAA